MSVYIKGMEMPGTGRYLIVYPDGRVVDTDIDGESQCIIPGSKAIPVPEHGDLIEYDFCLKNYELLHDDDGNPVYAVRMRYINDAPTIILADKEGEG